MCVFWRDSQVVVSLRSVSLYGVVFLWAASCFGSILKQIVCFHGAPPRPMLCMVVQYCVLVRSSSSRFITERVFVRCWFSFGQFRVLARSWSRACFFYGAPPRSMSCMLGQLCVLVRFSSGHFYTERILSDVAVCWTPSCFGATLG